MSVLLYITVWTEYSDVITQGLTGSTQISLLQFWHTSGEKQFYNIL